MTSRYPTEHGVREKTHRLSPRIPTLAEVLRREGYLTAAFTAGYFVDRKFGFDRGFEIYRQRYEVKRQNPGQSWRLEHMEGDLFSWLENHRMEDFFLFIHSYDVHQPLIAHDHLEEFSPSYDGWLTNLHNMQTFTASPDFDTFKAISEEDDFNINLFVQKIINRNLIDLNEADRQHMIALYDNEIRYADEYFSRLREKLEDLDLWDNTVIVLWSDHGEEFFERGGVRHGGPRLYEEILRVPLIVRIPGVEPTTMSNLTQSIDIAPTALEILGIPPQESFAGRSLFNADSRNSYVIAQGTGCECVRTDRMKLIFRRRGRIAELYDLEQDPNEKANVAEERPYQVEELRSQLYEATNRLVPDDHMQKQLRALGYID
jgi:arylsulfatase A-like enzyme